MDGALVNQSIHYHGPGLVDKMDIEQPSVPLPSFLSLGRPLNQEMPRDEAFSSELEQFIAQKADILFQKREPDCRVTPNEEEIRGSCAVTAPLEAYMGVPSTLSRRHFLQSVQQGDIVVGVVSAVQENGLIITLLGLDGGKARDINQLKIQAFCPLKEIPKYYAHESPLDAFAIKDKVRGVVVSISSETEKLLISLQTRALPPKQEHTKVGLISDEDLPLYFRLLERDDGASYDTHMKESSGFYNPSCVQSLCEMLGLNSDPPLSFMRGLYRVKYPPEDYKEVLRKKQSFRLAMKSVAEGVSLFKQERHTEAMQLFNKALDIDVGNVEALVARGALYANNESYNRAVDDFEEALEKNPTHVNAKTFLCETLVAWAGSFCGMGKDDIALTKCQRALELKPEMEEAQVLVSNINYKMAQQQGLRRRSGDIVTRISDSEQGGISEDDEEYKSLEKTTETLKRLIQEEKHHKKKKRRRSSPSPERVKKRRRSSSPPARRRQSTADHHQYINSGREQESPADQEQESQETIPLYRADDLSPGSAQYVHQRNERLRTESSGGEYESIQTKRDNDRPVGSLDEVVSGELSEQTASVPGNRVRSSRFGRERHHHSSDEIVHREVYIRKSDLFKESTGAMHRVDNEELEEKRTVRVSSTRLEQSRRYDGRRERAEHSRRHSDEGQHRVLQRSRSRESLHSGSCDSQSRDGRTALYSDDVKRDIHNERRLSSGKFQSSRDKRSSLDKISSSEGNTSAKKVKRYKESERHEKSKREYAGEKRPVKREPKKPRTSGSPKSRNLSNGKKTKKSKSTQEKKKKNRYQSSSSSSSSDTNSSSSSSGSSSSSSESDSGDSSDSSGKHSRSNRQKKSNKKAKPDIQPKIKLVDYEIKSSKKKKSAKKETKSSGESPQRSKGETSNKRVENKGEQDKKRIEDDKDRPARRESLEDMEAFLMTLKQKKAESKEKESAEKPKSSYKRW